MKLDLTKLTVEEQQLLQVVDSARIEKDALIKKMESTEEDIASLESVKSVLEFEIKTLKERKVEEAIAKNVRLEEKEAILQAKTQELNNNLKDFEDDVYEFTQSNIALNERKEQLNKDKLAVDLLRNEVRKEAAQLSEERKQLSLKLEIAKASEWAIISRENNLQIKVNEFDEINKRNIAKDDDLKRQSLALSDLERQIQSKNATVNSNIAGVELWKKQLEAQKANLDAFKLELDTRQTEITNKETDITSKLNSFALREDGLKSRELKIDIAEKEVRIRELQLLNSNLDKKLS